MTELIDKLVGHVGRGLQSIKNHSFLVAWCDELMAAISLDDRVATAAEASQSRALEHRHRLGPLGLSLEELLHKHAAQIFILINIKY